MPNTWGCAGTAGRVLRLRHRRRPTAVHGDAILAQGLIRQRWGFLPGQFLANLDDASIEPENGGWKISFYKNNERIVFQDTGRIYEDAICTQKWPFLLNFLIS